MKEKELRDEFAMAVVGCLIEKVRIDEERHYELTGDAGQLESEWGACIARQAYIIADACMAEREKL